jgi:hypothetical protein
MARIHKGHWYRAAHRPTAKWHLLQDVLVNPTVGALALMGQCGHTTALRNLFEVVADKPTDGRLCEKCLGGK